MHSKQTEPVNSRLLYGALLTISTFGVLVGLRDTPLSDVRLVALYAFAVAIPTDFLGFLLDLVPRSRAPGVHPAMRIAGLLVVVLAMTSPIVGVFLMFAHYSSAAALLFLAVSGLSVMFLWLSIKDE